MAVEHLCLGRYVESFYMSIVYGVREREKYVGYGCRITILINRSLYFLFNCVICVQFNVRSSLMILVGTILLYFPMRKILIAVCLVL